MRWRGPSGAVLAVALVAAGACGSDDVDPLTATERDLATVEHGALDLQLSASAGEGDDATGAVGFRLTGPFSFEAGPALAVFDLTYTQLLGGDELTTQVRSTGAEAFVTVDDETVRVPDSQLGPLRLAEGDAGPGLDDLGISGWIDDPEVSPGDDVDGEPTERITGDLDVADLLSDLARVSAALTGDAVLTALDEATADRLRELVRSSEVEVVTGAEDHRLRSLRAVADFGAAVPEELRASLGAYAGARIEITLGLAALDGALRVDAPAVADP